ncbi:CCHC-type zinc finger, nucleic acid binding protein a [Elysia marginata]|uniref:CCHC-type zinc finger, nucleic acid binding protein a n=1 Tax=Elysia marginata TaxID=1093978 RepID=A0AAV4IEJ4_9GAST|nr:CCHC-type zinc finger, nucleic acid binding protein a [Elysia marginata]
MSKPEEDRANSILVDSGATSHIINDKSKFITFSKHFNIGNKQSIEFTDGSRSDDLIKNIGDAQIQIIDKDGQSHNATLKNALYIPSFSLDIFSVHAATINGATISFTKNTGNLLSHGTDFPISKRGNLHYLESVATSTHGSHTCRSLKEWHETMGHCTIKDLLSPQGVTNGMNISDIV